MGLFRQPKPRRFRHPYIYVDERKECLERMREEARRELGMPRERPVCPEDIRGKLMEQTTHLRRRKERGTTYVASGCPALSHRPAGVSVVFTFEELRSS